MNLLMMLNRVVPVCLFSTMILAACVPTSPSPASPVTLEATVVAAGYPPTSTPPSTNLAVSSPSAEVFAIVTATTSCRFGPDRAYIPRFRVGVGTFRVAGRDDSAQWLEIYPLDNSKSCWVEARVATLDRDISQIPVVPVHLVVNSKYPPPTILSANRSGDQVQIAWSDVPLQTGDLPPASRFLLDLWLCADGNLSHTLLATNELSANVTDPSGCAEKSHGQIYTVTRTGYSIPADIPWPAP